jgi:hypothetical protein
MERTQLDASNEYAYILDEGNREADKIIKRFEDKSNTEINERMALVETSDQYAWIWHLPKFKGAIRITRRADKEIFLARGSKTLTFVSKKYVEALPTNKN